MLKIEAIKCAKCNDIIYSRARHDFHWCSCKAVSIDGGFDYTKITGNFEDILHTTINIAITKEDLYADWKNGIDNYGRIQPKEPFIK